MMLKKHLTQLKKKQDTKAAFHVCGHYPVRTAHGSERVPDGGRLEASLGADTQAPHGHGASRASSGCQ